MASTRPAVTVSRDRLDEAASVLAAAFEPDPMIRYLFEVADAPYQDCVLALMRFSCLVRYDLDWPLFAVEEGGRILGVLGVSMPAEKEWPHSLNQTHTDLKNLCGEEPVRRLEEYSAIADAHRPKEPHYHVGVLGVSPQAQGRGAGRTLLEAVHAMSAADPTTIGVVLDTENPESKKFYEACGYHQIAEHQYGPASIWHMFRPD